MSSIRLLLVSLFLVQFGGAHERDETPIVKSRKHVDQEVGENSYPTHRSHERRENRKLQGGTLRNSDSQTGGEGGGTEDPYKDDNCKLNGGRITSVGEEFVDETDSH